MVRVAACVLAIAAFSGQATAATSPAGRPVGPGPQLVDFDDSYEPGTLVVKTSERRLYLALGNGKAYRYRIAVGEPIRQWSGESWVSAKRVNPDWRPTPRMRNANPSLPSYVRGGAGNPLGVRALYLGWSEFRIHGTTKPSSIGTASSNGCFRMYNADVVDLYERVHVGAPVVVLR
ncbi:ErfK/YbiS/YcfS/YnhG protein [Blastochloris viridis]|uniref:ErfK/YbiS/YcfS/YnhG protein n=1 Tax=Blastochloris viridis TaxID=1079 RepID=A0A182CZ30_BLAVI|nr:ErfK/YbiS/YcfS/YnhG protein [Blastochloris viridis]